MLYSQYQHEVASSAAWAALAIAISLAATYGFLSLFLWMGDWKFHAAAGSCAYLAIFSIMEFVWKMQQLNEMKRFGVIS